jgi:hypothetical protein
LEPPDEKRKAGAYEQEADPALWSPKPGDQARTDVRPGDADVRRRLGVCLLPGVDQLHVAHDPEAEGGTSEEHDPALSHIAIIRT